MKNLSEPAVAMEIRQRVASLSPDSRRVWGKMSCHGMICHLADSFDLPLGRKSVADASNPFSRNVMKWFALNAPAPWPKGIPTRPEVEQGIGGTAPTIFESDRTRLLNAVELFLKADLTGRRHPMFGAMKPSEWHRWAYLHADHHLRQFNA